MTSWTPGPSITAMDLHIDIVIPVYNGARLVTRAVESVLAQTGKWNLHIFCVDDGSSDDSLTVLHALASRHPNLTVLANGMVNFEDGHQAAGAAAARNRGLAAGTSPLVAFLDQDDEWVPGRLAMHVPLFAADPALLYAVGAQQFILDEGYSRPSWCRAEWLESPQAGFVPSALMVRREAWNVVGPLDSTAPKGGDDLNWFARARTLGVPFIALNEVVVNRYVHADNTSSDVYASNLAVLDAVRRNLKLKGALRDA